MKHYRLGWILAVAGVAAACAGHTAVQGSSVASGTPAPVSGEEVVRMMRAKYAGTFYRTMIFKQTTTQFDEKGVGTQSIWYESLANPGLLRIDQGNPADGNGVIYKNDSLFAFKAGKLTNASPGGNPFITLIFDVYLNPADHTIELLKKRGFDLTKVSSAMWDGRPAWVVGALTGDTVSNQFWVDTERLMLVRQIAPTRPGATRTLDLQGYHYVRAGKAWAAAKFEFHVGGRLTQTEEYFDIKVGQPIDPQLFDPAKYSTAPNWAKP